MIIHVGSGSREHGGYIIYIYMHEGSCARLDMKFMRNAQAPVLTRMPACAVGGGACSFIPPLLDEVSLLAVSVIEVTLFDVNKTCAEHFTPFPCSLASDARMIMRKING